MRLVNGWNVRRLIGGKWEIRPGIYRSDFAASVFRRRGCKGVEWVTPTGHRVRFRRGRLAVATAGHNRRPHGDRILVNIDLATRQIV